MVVLLTQFIIYLVFFFSKLSTLSHKWNARSEKIIWVLKPTTFYKLPREITVQWFTISSCWLPGARCSDTPSLCERDESHSFCWLLYQTLILHCSYIRLSLERRFWPTIPDKQTAWYRVGFKFFCSLLKGRKVLLSSILCSITHTGWI